MSISVIIPSCGRPNLEYAVASVKQQLHAGDELIVVSPRRPEVLKPHYDIRDDFTWVPFENGGYHPESMRSLNTGPGYPSGGPERDAGLALARGSHVMVIDDDDLYLPHALEAARHQIETSDPAAVHIFRMRYGCSKQWRSPFVKNLRQGWNRGLDEHEWALWGEPLLEIGNVGSAMCLFPNDPRIRWDRSAPGGKQNESEDFWVVKNFVVATKRRPVFVPLVIGIIKPTPAEIGEVLGIDPPDVWYAPQPVVKWDGRP